MRVGVWVVAVLVAGSVSGCGRTPLFGDPDPRCTAAPRAPDTPPLVFALGGQSNMSGKGRLSELPDGFPAHGERITNFTNAWTFAPAAEPLDDPRDQLDRVSADLGVPGYPGVGPGLAFADALAGALDHDVILVPASMSGTRARDWLPTPDRPRDTLYGSMLARLQHAAGHGEIAGLLWYQGESDGMNAADAERWAENTQAMWDQLRADLGRPDLPVVFVRLPTPGPASYPLWEEVRAQQATRVRVDQPMVQAPRGPYVEEDTLHLSTAAHLRLGPALAEAWLSTPVGQRWDRGCIAVDNPPAL